MEIEMISANHLPKFTYDQLIHVNRINTTQNAILSACSQGLQVAVVSFELTANEVSYLTLYGYRVFTSIGGTSIFWVH